MINLRVRSRGATIIGTSLVAAASAILWAAAPAGASTNAAQNANMIGGGSATTYNLMQGVDTLYNSALGCNLITISSVPQPLDYSCPTAADTSAPPTVGSFGNYPAYSSTDTSQDGYTENPANDISVQEPPYGSSNGIKALETQGTGSTCASTTPTSIEGFARSSRAFASTDCKGLNFVAYAVDGVTWFSYPEVNGHTTPSAAVTNLTQQLLIDVWTGTLQCWNDPAIASNGTPSMTYTSAGCQPIIVYAAQEGSGTAGTWESYLGGIKNTTYPNSINGVSIPNVQNTTGGTFTETYNSAQHVSLENTDRQIVANGDEANAIFFFSWGKFQVTCATGDCGKVPGATGTTTESLGKINGIAASKNTILCGAAVGGTGCGPTADFAPSRFIYNVYSNGSNPAIPEATPSVLNYVSEEGFVCKPNSTNGTNQAAKDIIDPTTGNTYRSEISAVITGAGFIPMPFQTNEGTVTHPVKALLTTYAGKGNNLAKEAKAADEVGQGASPKGFCLVTTTDNNTTS